MAQKRGAQGAGNIRQRKDGRWEARYTTGSDPGTGKQIQKSIYGTSQKEVLAKLQQVHVALKDGTYTEPTKMTVGAWADVWEAEYLGGIKQSTQASYRGHIRNHIKPALGHTPLQKLKPHQIQAFYNTLHRGGTSAKTIKNIHGVLHSLLRQAQYLDYIHTNPTERCTLPRIVKKEMKVLDDGAVARFLKAIEGNRFESLFFVDLFTGMRLGEILGLTWDAIDFKSGTILVSKQLVRPKGKNAIIHLDTPKHDKVRKIKPAPVVMDKLKERKHLQIEQQLAAGPAWNNPWNLVFTNELGRHLMSITVYNEYKRVVSTIGI